MNSRSLGLLILGVLLLLAGATFSLQGANYIGGSSMTGSPFWLYAGAGVAIVGVILLFGALAMRARGKASPASGM